VRGPCNWISLFAKTRTGATIELFPGLQIDINLDITGRCKKLTRSEYPKFKKRVWSSAIHATGDDIVKLMYAGNRCLMKSMVRSGVKKFQDENRSTLIVSWRNPGASLSSDLGCTAEGSVSILESTAAGFEKSYDSLANEVAEELQVEMDFVRKAVAVISHRTKDAIGSNAYSAYNDIVIIGEPYKPSEAVTLDRSWQGDQLTAKTDMMAALLQSIGRGVIRLGSASSPRLQNVFLFDISTDLIPDIQDYFSLVTHVIDGHESNAKAYDRLARSLLDFLMNRLAEANDDFVNGFRFLSAIPAARLMSKVCVHVSDVEHLDYDLETMSRRIRKYCKNYPEITITENLALVTATPAASQKREEIWKAIMMHSVVKQLWNFRHIRTMFEDDIHKLQEALYEPPNIGT